MYLYLQKYKDSSRFSIMLKEELLSITSFQLKVSIFTKTLKVLFGIQRMLVGSPNQPVYANLTCPKNTLLGFALNIWCASISWISIYLSIYIYIYIYRSTPLSHHHQSRHNRLVENPSLWYKLFQKFHPSIQLHIPTDPPIRLVPHVLQVHHHERSFHLLHHHSHPQDHVPFAVTSRNLHMAPNNSYHWIACTTSDTL